MAAPAGPRVSAAQTTLLVEFMEQHPYLARGATSLSPSRSAAHKKALWNELTAALNALGPAVKTAQRWRQYWARIVHDFKKLAAQVGSEKMKTGGGRLGGLEGRVLDVLSRTGPGYAPVDFFADDAEPQRPPRQQQLLEDEACRAAEECARQRQLAEAANVEAVAFHQMLLEQHRQHHQQLVEEQRASRVVQQQLVVETRALREATALVAATLRQLVATLARGLREPPQP
ncbi:hypothetical protein HPB49_006995 [Dermacentor silvarum]|uniref:Uncharacterized protein n=1 Tax=Dermacentor silvarum TaxID=543639 RepID=A0ACB8C7U0_DERSI|nr:hypothetical protein HPB49_006995 [Dermacentor silvarum]